MERGRLAEDGLRKTTVDSWLRNGRLVAAWPGVYAVGHVPSEPRARAFGAVLAAGDAAGLAGWSAAAFYGCTKAWEPFELISPSQKRIAGLTVHRCATLRTRDIWRFDGLRVTSPARTALDLAGKPKVDRQRLHRIVDRLRLDHRLTLLQLLDVVERNPRHPGARPIRRLVRVLGKSATRSELERRWPAVAAEHGLTPYEQNVLVDGEEVDVLIDGLVIVELDTIDTHLLNFESDRHRDAKVLAASGMPTIRLLDTDLEGDMTLHAQRIRETLERRRRETRRM